MTDQKICDYMVNTILATPNLQVSRNLTFFSEVNALLQTVYFKTNYELYTVNYFSDYYSVLMRHRARVVVTTR